MKNKKLLSDIKEYLKYYENQVLEDWYELIRHISVSDKVFCKTRSGPGREVWQ